jgi:hypothetical protein
MQCLGRLTKEKKNVPVFKFENRAKYGFFTAIQCTKPADGELCRQCLERQKKIPELLIKWKGSMQNQSQQLHGLINGEIPEWSRIYGGAWVNSKLREGFTISEEVLEMLGTDIRSTHKDSMTNTIEMEKEKEKEKEKKKKPRKKAVKKEVVKPVELVKPVEVLKPVEKPLKIAKKKVGIPKQTPILGVVDPVPLEEPIIVKIKVRQIEIDGRTVYLNSGTDKVYDTKFNYLGRYNRKDDCIDSSYRDSDSDLS